MVFWGGFTKILKVLVGLTAFMVWRVVTFAESIFGGLCIWLTETHGWDWLLYSERILIDMSSIFLSGCSPGSPRHCKMSLHWWGSSTSNLYLRWILPYKLVLVLDPQKKKIGILFFFPRCRTFATWRTDNPLYFIATIATEDGFTHVRCGRRS